MALCLSVCLSPVSQPQCTALTHPPPLIALVHPFPPSRHAAVTFDSFRFAGVAHLAMSMSGAETRHAAESGEKQQHDEQHGTATRHSTPLESQMATHGED